MPIVDTIDLPTGVLSASTSEPAGAPISGVPTWGTSIRSFQGAAGGRVSVIPPVFDDEYVYAIGQLRLFSAFGPYWAFFMAKVSQRTRQIEWIRELPRINNTPNYVDALWPAYAHNSGVYIAGGKPQGSKLYRLDSAGNATQLNFLNQRDYNISFQPGSVATSLDNLTISAIGTVNQTEVPYIPPTPTQGYIYAYTLTRELTANGYSTGFYNGFALPSGSQFFGYYFDIPYNVKVYQNGNLIHDISGTKEFVFGSDDGFRSIYTSDESNYTALLSFTGPIPQRGSTTSSTSLRVETTFYPATQGFGNSINFVAETIVVAGGVAPGGTGIYNSPGYHENVLGSAYYRFPTLYTLKGQTVSTNSVAIPTAQGNFGQAGIPAGTNYYDIKINTLNNNVSASNIFFRSEYAFSDGIDSVASDGISNYYIGTQGNQFFIQKRNAINSGAEALWYYPLGSGSSYFYIKYFMNYLYVVERVVPTVGGDLIRIYKIDRANGSVIDQTIVDETLYGSRLAVGYVDSSPLSSSFYAFTSGSTFLEVDLVTGEVVNDQGDSESFLSSDIKDGESWSTFIFKLDYSNPYVPRIELVSKPNTLNKISLGSTGWNVGKIGI